jgi:hypothetical protein
VLLGTCAAGNYYPNLSPLEYEPSMKALFLGTLAASQATPIIEFITADIRTEILHNSEPAQAAAAVADADVLLTGVWPDCGRRPLQRAYEQERAVRQKANLRSAPEMRQCFDIAVVLDGPEPMPI